MAITQGLAGAGGGGTGGAVTQSGTWTVGLSAGANTIGKVDQGVGGASAWKVDGTGGSFPVAGSKTNNNAAPGATNVGTLSALANAAAPAWSEGNQVALSTDLAGNLRVLLGKVAGTVSTANSSTATLTSGSVFTGTAEDISGVAALVVNVFADQAGTFSPQFSSDGANWDFQGSHVIAAGVGQMFVFRPGTKFFRAVYTNGGTNQGAFRFQTVYHSAEVDFATAQTLVAGMANPTTVMVGASLLVQPAGGTTWSPAAADSSARQIVAVNGLPTAAAVGDSFANPTTTQIVTLPSIWNGATWDHWKDMAAAQAQTSFTGVPAMAPFYLDTTGTPSVRRGVTGASCTGGITGTQVPGSASLVWDGTVFRPQLADTGGRTVVMGAAATATTLVGNPVLVAGSDGTNARSLSCDTNGNIRANVTLGTATANVAAVTDGIGAGNQSLSVAAYPMLYNGASADRMRGNFDTTLLASASRTTTQGPTTLTTYNLGAINFVLDMTSVGTGSVTLTISEVDPASGKSILLLSGAAVTTNSTNVYTIDPMLTAAANSIAKARTPRTLSWTVTANNANPATYSLGAMELMP